MRALLVVIAAALLATPTLAHAEDTAAVITALPNKQAEQRYLQQLCTTLARGEQIYFDALDAYAACAQRLCSEAQPLLLGGNGRGAGPPAPRNRLHRSRERLPSDAER